MVMIATEGRGYVSSEAVVEMLPAEKNKYGVERTRLVGAGEKTLGFATGSPDRVAERVATLIPAAPGFFIVLESVEADDVDMDPIIAWRCDYLGITPISADGFQELSQNWAVLRPDGKVFEPEAASWPSVQAWFDHLQAKRNASTAPAARLS